MKAYEILPGKLYQRGDTRKASRSKKLAWLRDKQVQVVVNLYWKRDPDLIGVEGLEYLHVPFADGRGPKSLSALPYLADIARDLAPVMEARAIMTACYGGLNRSGVMSALLVHEYLGCTGHEAIGYVQTARPRALNNEYFCGYLNTLL